MSSTDSETLPNVAEILGPLLARVRRHHQPLLLAIAERMAADRYRSWAANPAMSAHEPDLLACAEREEEIARKVEARYDDAAAIQQQMRTDHPDLEEINREVFKGRPLSHQFKIQAEGEHLGAAAWRDFANTSSNEAAEVFLACADLEEANARVLETLLDAGF